MIDQIEMMRLIENIRGDAIVVPAMRANVGWSQVSNNINRDVPASGAMGKTCSFGLDWRWRAPIQRLSYLMVTGAC